jgi:hypothetical protein
MRLCDRPPGKLPERPIGLLLAVLWLPVQLRQRISARHVEGYKMNNTSLFCVMIAAAAFAGHAEAIYKCKTPRGVVYQDRPCLQGQETDLQIVIPTGEVAPRSVAEDEDAQAGVARADARLGAQPSAGARRDDRAAARTADTRANGAGTAASADTRRKDARSNDESSGVPMTAEQARKTEPSAKYYTTDAFSVGPDTPEQMTCESPSGEKRRFMLTNGKLTSI